MSSDRSIRVAYDAGTIVVDGLGGLPVPRELRADPRFGLWRGFASDRTAIVDAVARLGVHVDDRTPRAVSLSGLRLPDLRPYQQTALDACGSAGVVASSSCRPVGGARRIVMAFKRRRLICQVRARTADLADVHVQVSGPLSLLRHTRVYGHTLASIVPLLPWSERWRLRARVLSGGHPAVAVLESGDPIAPAAEPPRYDSQVEERFARKFLRLAPSYRLIREPEPLDVGGGALAFPDFAIEHRSDPARRWLLEIVGYWTEAYLRKKLDQLRALRQPVIVAIDEQLGCEGEIGAHARLIRFRRHLDPAAVLAVVAPAAPLGTRRGSR